MAPEILSLKRYDAKADLWSVGAVLFEMLAGEPPFSGRDHRELLKNIKRKALRLPRDVAVSGECLKVLQILLKRDPIARCAFEEFFANAFVSGTGELSPAVFEPPMATATMPLSRSLTRDRQPWKPPVAPPPPRLADLAQSGSDEFVVADDFYATRRPADPTARPLDDEGLRAAETLAHGAMVLVKVADDLSRDVDEELDATRVADSVAERPGPRALAIYVDCLKHLTKASHLVGDSGRPREGDRERSGRRSPGSLRDLDVLDRDATAAKLRDYIDDAYAVILDRAKHCEAHVETLEGLADESLDGARALLDLAAADGALSRSRCSRRPGDAGDE
ncbi:serine/threonine kinase [Aureococcus anophagefferens]|nr:serine/threonine kinase [Aureococcus anophagefferens]